MTAPTRRRLLGLLLSTALETIGDRVLGGPLDQGIGGTGIAPGDESDRGIGGTGVIGTIRKFGSIVVNDMRIAYSPDAEIRIDDRPASVTDLKIGQVVRVAASGAQGNYATRVIDVTSEVVGPVERVTGKQIVVLGQTVSTQSLKNGRFKVGDTIAVGGLRRNDGTIVASLIERRDGAPSRVAGPVQTGGDGSLRIGGLTVSGVSPSLIGRRVLLEGQGDGGHFAVVRARTEASLLPASVRSLSIETYVERRNGSLSLGSGFRVKDSKDMDVPAGKSVRAVVTTSVGPDGQLTVDSVRTNGRPTDGGNNTNGGAKSGPAGRNDPRQQRSNPSDAHDPAPATRPKDVAQPPPPPVAPHLPSSESGAAGAIGGGGRAGGRKH